MADPAASSGLAGSQNPADSSVGELFGQLGRDGRAFVQAEIGLFKAIAAHRIGKARNGAVALLLALLLINAALIALIVSIVLALAIHVGPLLAGMITFVAISVLAGLLGWWGAGRMSALGGDEEERKAMGQGTSPR